MNGPNQFSITLARLLEQANNPAALPYDRATARMAIRELEALSNRARGGELSSEPAIKQIDPSHIEEPL